MRQPVDSLRQFAFPSSTDVTEQRAIAHILGTLDDKIELNRRMNETLEAMARALFKSWFVDFDPVRAKAEGRDPGCRRTSLTSSPLASSTPNSARFPRGGTPGLMWLESPTLSGGTPSKTEPRYWDGDIPLDQSEGDARSRGRGRGSS